MKKDIDFDSYCAQGGISEFEPAFDMSRAIASYMHENQDHLDGIDLTNPLFTDAALQGAYEFLCDWAEEDVKRVEAQKTELGRRILGELDRRTPR